LGALRQTHAQTKVRDFGTETPPVVLRNGQNVWSKRNDNPKCRLPAQCSWACNCLLYTSLCHDNYARKDGRGVWPSRESPCETTSVTSPPARLHVTLLNRGGRIMISCTVRSTHPTASPNAATSRGFPSSKCWKAMHPMLCFTESMDCMPSVSRLLMPMFLRNKILRPESSIPPLRLVAHSWP
jgi:hypothetical protein